MSEATRQLTLPDRTEAASSRAGHGGDSTFWSLTLGSVGVVYGDIGTSPLYAFREALRAAVGAGPITQEAVLGVLSMIIWSLTIVVTAKYVLLLLRADNHGEGGTLSLTALASRALGRRTVPVVTLGIVGAAMFYGDSVITPAISVLSAVEGLTIVTPALEHIVLPATVIILVLLFAVQSRGTAHVAAYFGPVMVVWFVALAALGLYHIADEPHIFGAINPVHAVAFVVDHPVTGLVTLGAVFLAVTGGEALYADLGHFGRRPIRTAWFALVFPALVINYFGQGAMLLIEPERVSNPFYEMAPTWALYPLIGLATCATVIASQALITAAYSVTKQAIQLGYLPRMRISHTSVRETGQIYVPFINWSLYVCIFVAILLFGSSSRLAAAYGITVTIDMLITTTMTFFVLRYGWKYRWSVCIAATGFFFIVDFTFFAGNIVKVFDGGWFPLLLGAVMFTFMMTWKQGRKLMSDSLRDDAIDLRGFLESVFISPPTRVAGTAVFLVSEPGLTPNALLHNLKHNKVLHDTNLFVHVQHHEVPWVGFDKRCDIEPLGHDCWQVSLHFGFKNDPDVPEALTLLRGRGVQLDDMDTSYFLSRDIVMPTIGKGMPVWREKLFASMHRNASAAADFLNLPTNRVVELGSKVEI